MGCEPEFFKYDDAMLSDALDNAYSQDIIDCAEYVVEQEAGARRARMYGEEASERDVQSLEFVVDFVEAVTFTGIALESLIAQGHQTLAGLRDPPVRERFRVYAGSELHVFGELARRIGARLSMRPGREDLDIRATLDEIVAMGRSFAAGRGVVALENDAWRLERPELAHRARSAWYRLGQLLERHTAPNVALSILGTAYAQGRLSLAELSGATGIASSDLVFELERLGHSRTPNAIRLTAEERASRFAQLASARPASGIDESRLRRDIVSTHRIEGLDARPWTEAPARAEA